MQKTDIVTSQEVARGTVALGASLEGPGAHFSDFFLTLIFKSIEFLPCLLTYLLSGS